jgi:hypothetical protein
VFRLLFLALLAAAAFVLIEAHWSRESLTLTLRVRTAKELVAATQGKARQLGERAVERVMAETPAVGAAPAGEPEKLGDADRARLNKLVEEQSREK